MHDDDQIIRTEADAIAEVALLAAEPDVLEEGTLYSTVVPHGAQQVTIDTHDLVAARKPTPQRRRGTVHAIDAASLSRLVKDLGPENGTVRIYADPTDTSITAILNDHLESDGTLETGNAGWQDHRIVFRVERTEDWNLWRERNGIIGEQLDFAEHLEQLLHTVTDPEQADLLEIAQTFEASIEAQFAQGQRLSSGERELKYVEHVEASAGRERKLAIPESITFRVEPFEGSFAIDVNARLRFRVRGNKLSIGYQIDRPDRVERQAFDSLMRSVAHDTSVQPYMAKAPAVR